MEQLRKIIEHLKVQETMVYIITLDIGELLSQQVSQYQLKWYTQQT